jgi:hypothetical protein
MWRTIARWIGVVAGGLAMCAGEGWAGPRADIVVYADHQPPPITTNPFSAQEDPDDPITKILLERVPGLYNPLGSQSWEVEAWGKYVLLSNYDEKGGGLFQNIVDQRIGVFDTEKKTFCQLDLDPTTTVSRRSGRPSGGASRDSGVALQAREDVGRVVVRLVESAVSPPAPAVSPPSTAIAWPVTSETSKPHALGGFAARVRLLQRAAKFWGSRPCELAERHRVV